MRVENMRGRGSLVVWVELSFPCLPVPLGKQNHVVSPILSRVAYDVTFWIRMFSRLPVVRPIMI
jgi:hypothetical protein